MCFSLCEVPSGVIFMLFSYRHGPAEFTLKCISKVNVAAAPASIFISHIASDVLRDGSSDADGGFGLTVLSLMALLG